MTLLLSVIIIFLAIGFLYRKRMYDLAYYLLGYGVLNLVSESFKLMLLGHPKPFVGEDLLVFIIANGAYLALPCWLLYCLLKSYDLTDYLKFPITVWATAVALLVYVYPEYLAGKPLIAAFRAYYLSMLGISLIVGVILFFYRKANLPQSLLLLAAAEGILQYLIAIFSPNWGFSWIVLACYYALLIALLVLPYKYIHLFDSLTADSSPQ